jgi:hypothetical protein
MRRFLRILAVGLLPIVIVAPVAAAPAHASGGLRILAPSSNPFGKTYGQWSAVWWQYVFSVPDRQNPLKDLTGANCAVGQSGPVFYLGGLYGVPGTVDRTCRVPAGRALFFPIVNNEAENTVPPDTRPTHYSATTLARACAAGINSAHDLSAELDGTPVTGLSPTGIYRAAAPTFSITPPDNNLLQVAGFVAPGGVTISPVAADGVYLMIAPPSLGSHTIHFRGEIGTFGPLDVTYHLIVTP